MLHLYFLGNRMTGRCGANAYERSAMQNIHLEYLERASGLGPTLSQRGYRLSQTSEDMQGLETLPRVILLAPQGFGLHTTEVPLH